MAQPSILFYKGCAKAAEAYKGIYGQSFPASIHTSPTSTRDKIEVFLRFKIGEKLFAPVFTGAKVMRKITEFEHMMGADVKRIAIKVAGVEKRKRGSKIKQLNRQFLSDQFDKNRLLNYAKEVKDYYQILREEEEKHTEYLFIDDICKDLRSYFNKQNQIKQTIPLEDIKQMLIICPRLLPACVDLLCTSEKGTFSLSEEGISILADMWNACPQYPPFIPPEITLRDKDYERLFEKLDASHKAHWPTVDDMKWSIELCSKGRRPNQVNHSSSLS